MLSQGQETKEKLCGGPTLPPEPISTQNLSIRVPCGGGPLAVYRNKPKTIMTNLKIFTCFLCKFFRNKTTNTFYKNMPILHKSKCPKLLECRMLVGSKWLMKYTPQFSSHLRSHHRLWKRNDSRKSVQRLKYGNMICLHFYKAKAR